MRVAMVALAAGLLAAPVARAADTSDPGFQALDGLARFYGMQFAAAQTAQNCAVNVEQQRAYFTLMEGWAGLIRALPAEFQRPAAEAVVAANRRYGLMAFELRCETARDDHTRHLQAFERGLRR
jgi:hypothetical protein